MQGESAMVLSDTLKHGTEMATTTTCRGWASRSKQPTRLRANHDATTAAELSIIQPLWRRFVFVLHSVCSPVDASFAPRSHPAHIFLDSLASSGDLVLPARLCLRFVSTVDLHFGVAPSGYLSRYRMDPQIRWCCDRFQTSLSPDPSRSSSLRLR